MEFWIVNGKDVHKIVHDDLASCVRIVQDAYLAHHRGQSVNPSSHFLRFPDRPEARIIALPAFLGGDCDVSGIKWIASYPRNIQEGIPRASAVLILNRTDTGYPFACLEASVISAARTAASAVAAADALNENRRSVEGLAIIGTGYIARYVYEFLVSLGWKIGTVSLFDANPAEADRFQNTVCSSDRHSKVTVASDAATAIRGSDLVLFTTSAGAPYIDDPKLFEHNPIVLHLSLRDISPEIILGSSNVVDDIGHVMNAGTSVHLAEQASGGRSFVNGTLAQVLLGEVRVDRSRPIIFSPFGLGILDLAVGKWVFDQARATGRATAVPDFFFDLTR
jgi:N-[(2S)-2-amino-2-carboxyethyl]-L-glutamate dehydrogenase